MAQISLVNNSNYLAGFEWDRQVAQVPGSGGAQDFFEFFDLENEKVIEAHTFYMPARGVPELLPQAQVTNTTIENIIMLSRPAHTMGVILTPREMLKEITLRNVRGEKLIALLKAYEHTAHYRHDAWDKATDSYPERLKELLAAEGYLVAESKEWQVIYRAA